MINKYTELHERFMELLVQYHNNHIYFMNRPSVWTSRDMVRTMLEISRVVKAIKQNNVVMRKAMRQQIRDKKKVKQSKEK